MKLYGKTGILGCDEVECYRRQTMLKEVGEEGQKKINQAKVLIVGVGGLGSPIAMYLAAVGVCIIALIDDDFISLSNLQRQVFYQNNEVGESKTEQIAEKITKLNPYCKVVTYNNRLTSDNSQQIIRDYDIVVDACDNYETRYTIDAICKKQQKPYIYGSVAGFNGQIGVFNYNGSCSYTDVFPYEENTELTNQTIGVLGSLPVLVASLQTTEVFKIILDKGQLLTNQLLIIDLLNMKFTKFLIKH